MEISLDCVPCFVRQALEASRMVGAEEALQEKLLRKVLGLLQDLDFRQTPPHMARVIHEAIREELGAEDPYRDVKERSNRLALGLYDELLAKMQHSTEPFATAVRLAIAGNIIDFGQGDKVDRRRLEAAIAEALQQPLSGRAVSSLQDAVDKAASILYLGDNAGEVVFDRLLIEQMPLEKVTFVVRGRPVLNDATRIDAEFVGLHRLVEVIDNGSGAPGTILESCSAAFRKRFEQADLIISKGQGNYETLSSVTRPVYFLLKVKCPVIARHLGSELGQLVIHSTAGFGQPAGPGCLGE